MSKGLGSRERAILAKLAQHHEHPPDYNEHVEFWADIVCGRFGEERRSHYVSRVTDRYPEWMTVRELAGLSHNDLHCHRSSDIESTRRAVRTLEVAGLVETRMVWRHGCGQRQIGVRLRPNNEEGTP